MNMVKVLSLRLKPFFDSFTTLPVKGSSERDFLDIYLTTFFRVRNFRNSYPMRLIFFWKCSNFDVYLKNAHKNSKNFFFFCDKSIWIVWIELFLLKREYLSSAVNVLAKSLNSLHVTRSFFFQLNYLQNRGRIW